MLAARERGIGSCWTTLHLEYEREVGQLLGIPDDHSQVALTPLAYTRGTDFRPAPRREILFLLSMRPRMNFRDLCFHREHQRRHLKL